MTSLPSPIFDTLDNVLASDPQDSCPAFISLEDYSICRAFLLSYRGSEDTFNSYRREVERYLQWIYCESDTSLTSSTADDIVKYIEFCSEPPVNWISTKNHPRYIDDGGHRVPNEDWRPFQAKVSKAARAKGKSPSAEDYVLSNSAKKATLRILSSFFGYLELENYVQYNPVRRIRQKSQLTTSRSGPDPVRRLTVLQWQYTIETCRMLADEEPVHERGLFILSCLYLMYLRVSELAKSDRHTPMMKDFHKDSDGAWWFRAVGKGNKERDISVSDDMVKSLKRYRNYLGLSELPGKTDDHPLILKNKGRGAISSTRQLRTIVQDYFDKSKERLLADGLNTEADELAEATVHWLRHTGISDDVQRRPKEHVREDAGHTSSEITDRYIDVDRRERHESSKHKPLIPD